VGGTHPTIMKERGEKSGEKMEELGIGSLELLGGKKGSPI